MDKMISHTWAQQRWGFHFQSLPLVLSISSMQMKLSLQNWEFGNKPEIKMIVNDQSWAPATWNVAALPLIAIQIKKQRRCRYLHAKQRPLPLL